MWWLLKWLQEQQAAHSWDAPDLPFYGPGSPGGSRGRQEGAVQHVGQQAVVSITLFLFVPLRTALPGQGVCMPWDMQDGWMDGWGQGLQAVAPSTPVCGTVRMQDIAGYQTPNLEFLRGWSPS